MRRRFTAEVWKEGDVYVSQCLEVDIASCGETEQDALESLVEAMELYFEHVYSRKRENLHEIEVEIRDASQAVALS